LKAFPRTRCLVLALILALELAACGKPEPVEEADKALFLRVADLARFGVRYEDAAAGEAFSKEKQLDGSYELTYKFQSPAGERSLYLYGNVSVGSKPSDAAMRAGALKVGLLIGVTKNGVEERELPATRTGKLTLLVKDEAPIGNVFTLTDGGKSHLVIMSGLYVKDPELWQKLIDPKLEQLSRYSPGGTL
jgi:hypothetical protein